MIVRAMRSAFRPSCDCERVAVGLSLSRVRLDMRLRTMLPWT